MFFSSVRTDILGRFLLLSPIFFLIFLPFFGAWSLVILISNNDYKSIVLFSGNPSKFFKRFNTPPFYKRQMPLLFGKSHKTPADVVRTLREVLIILDKLPPPRLDKDGNVVTDKKYDKALEEVSKNVAMIKAFIYGSDASEPSGDHVVQVAQLAQEVYNANVLPMLIKMLPKFEFECKKDVGQIFNNLLRRQIGTRSPTVEYLGARPEILIQLVQGYSVPDIALTCGLMLRESIRHDHLAKIILTSDIFYTFFSYVQSEVFDIASDAFSTFKELTTRHKAISAEFLDANYDTFFAQYQNLLNSKNYVTRRQSLKLLGELLLDRHNFNIMTKYISNPENLRLMMELLRDKSRNIQYEAFHVFKVFVANPNKPRPISDILNRNREKLVEFLGEFHNDRTDDEQFNDEKAYLIKQIQEMKFSPKEVKKHKKEEEHPVVVPEEPARVEESKPGPSGPSTSQQQ
uniref:Calcium-binding protein 39 n=2 Tax=Caenorhabditis tropicalis TaxID=1561998 RepID=A0A1I7UQ94_9PELO